MDTSLNDKPIKIANINNILGDVIEKTIIDQITKIADTKDDKNLTPLDFAKDLKDDKQIDAMTKFNKGDMTYAEMRMYCG